MNLRERLVDEMAAAYSSGVAAGGRLEQALDRFTRALVGPESGDAYGAGMNEAVCLVAAELGHPVDVSTPENRASAIKQILEEIRGLKAAMSGKEELLKLVASNLGYIMLMNLSDGDRLILDNIEQSLRDRRGLTWKSQSGMV